MAKTFFSTISETSGLSAGEDRIMQFAGQQTGMDLNPIGDPINVLVALNDGTIPDGSVASNWYYSTKDSRGGLFGGGLCRIS